MRYLVTGAAGFIGSHLVPALTARGDDVVGLDSFNDYYDPARKRENAADLDVLDADLLVADLDGLLADVDAVFHLAGQPGVRASFGPGFEDYVSRNVHASARLFEAAARRGIRVVYASSSSVYGDAERYPTSEDVTPQSHLAVRRDEAVRASTSPTPTRARPGSTRSASATSRSTARASARTWRSPRCSRPSPAARPSGSSATGAVSRSFTYVADAVSGTIAVMEHGAAGEIYNIGGGEESTMSDAIALAERIAGRKLAVERHGAAVGDVRRTRADAAKALAGVGWAPTTGLADGLRAPGMGRC